MFSRPMYLAGRALGLAPYTRDLTRSLPASWVYSAVVATLTLVGSGIFVMRFVAQFASGSGVPTPLFVTGVLLAVASSLAAASNVLWAATRARTHLDDVAKHMRDADCLLGRVDAQNAAGLLACAGVAVVVVNTYGLLFGGSNYELVLSRYLANSIIYYTVVHFVATTDALRARFRMINTCLVSAACRQSALTVVRVRDLRKAHQLLTEAAQTASAHFGPRLLGVTVHILVAMIIYVYVLVSFVQSRDLGLSNLGPSNLVHSAVTSAGWWLVNAVALVTVAMRAQAAAEEARRAQVLVLQCAAAQGAPIGEELHQFARQLLTNQVAFSACGVLRLDATMLLSVAATVTSYTFILLSA